MNWLSDLAFQRKLRFAILFTTGVAVLLACGVFLAFEYVARQRSLLQTIAALGQAAADNSTGSIAFDDPKRAQETLESLRAEPQVVAAVLTDKDGRVVATYRADPGHALPAVPPPTAGVKIVGDRVVGVHHVVQGSTWLGTLYVWASLDRIYDRMQVYGGVALAVLAATFALAWVLSSVLRDTIVRPVLELANTAGAIAAGEQDYSSRARQYGSDELGRLTAAFNAMLDRTQEAVTALRASEAQLRIVTDNASVYLAHCDRQYRYKFVNRPYAERFNIDPQSVIGRSVSEVVGPAAAHVIRPHMDAALAGNRVEFESELKYPSLGSRWMHVVYVPELSPEGEVIGFVAVITDITLRKQIEHDIARARDEALAASRAKDDFLAALSHELRTPLNPILLISSDAARDPGLAPEVREDFEIIRTHVELEARLIDDLLDLTAITRGKLSLERKRLNLHVVLRDALSTVSPDIDQKQIKLNVHTTADRAEVNGDPVRLLQVFWNVLKNAVKFTSPGGRISVETATREGRVSVRVTDSGIGLTAVELARIFDAFTQGDHAGEDGSHRFGGLGLGLAISRMVVELHKGTITATSEGRDRGASFVIELPQAAPLDPSDEVEESTGTPRTADVPARPFIRGGGQPRVLLVEDHAATRMALEQLLTRRNFSVRCAASIADARALVDGHQFDLLIADVGLPDGNGYELMEQIGMHCGRRGIALTGYGADEDLARSRKAGFSSHLTKPVRVQSLDAALASILGPGIWSRD